MGLAEKLLEEGAAGFCVGVAHGHGVGRGFSDDNDLLFAARNGGVDEIALKHHEVGF